MNRNPIPQRQPLKTETLAAPSGMQVTILNLGATIQSILVPVRGGTVSAALGYASLDDHWTDTNYMGTTVGRYANRIRGASFTLGSNRYQLEANETETGNCLHGGAAGLHKQLWDLERIDAATVVCRYSSPNGEGGFPGNVQVTVTYTIVDGYSLTIGYIATSDADTVLSLTNHAYFNLDNRSATIDEHELRLAADSYLPVGSDRVPTGEIAAVTHSDFDFRAPRSLNSTPGQAMRLDHNFCVSGGDGALCQAAELGSRSGGLRLRLHTTQPGLQVYTGDYLSGAFRPRQGLCLEAQAYPDAPNQPRFPTAHLAAGDRYSQQTVYEFAPYAR